ncbi:MULTISPECIES: undecaprenyl-diphosphate phosphatase [Cellulosilyticum]|uniref:Undecaprenyl-diphosphatase n=1 Tax=Cellulosilyticum lentocellum (strain ATCC 49066 / DSM 5427 / NCIMB 11756 / RHM5) TaxID=642492 RepID=F2JR40_CELLD|nr:MULTISPECIES: undecaprenyl-diphosphate phosphatase [Cellulosilyticum]ADZ85021.1 Undecaprenyl-diphosphatase [Cellulosilyticum lentocellum DSM 5427]QEH70520.1 undecaprenyl-diphosphate phosphatase [Cellulosilyticum sp. WCF-2]
MDLLFALKAAILGVVEGLTEFLPVSSTGHLIIFSNLLKFSDNTAFANMFTMVIQLGAILAVLVLYRKKIWDTIVHLFPSKNVSFEKSGLYFWLMIVISCVPAAAIGIPFDDLIEEKLFNPLVVACALFVGGLWMMYAESKLRGNQTTSLSTTKITAKMAIIVGLFQVLSIVPGMSRSASTIIGGWVAGFSTVAAAEYSFFLAIPVMFGQALLNILKAQGTLLASEWIALGIGFVVSFIVALAVIGSFISYLQKKPMKVFAIYRIIFAFVVLGVGMLGLF